MITLFKKASPKSEKELIEQIHNEFDTAPDRLLEQALKIIALNKNNLESNIEDKAKRLEKIGFTSNGLVKKMHDINERNSKKEKVIEVELETARKIQYYKNKYPFQKFLTIDELDRICDKYSLVYAPIANYKMPVPDKNLKEIEDFIGVDYHDRALKLNYVKYKIDDFYASELYVTPKEAEKWENPIIIKSNNNFLGTWDIEGYLRKKYGFNKMLMLENIEVTTIDRSGYFIAAPKNHFDLKNLKFDKKKGYFNFSKTVIQNDPIVFKYVKDGVLIITKWGLEATDPALQNEILN